MFVDPGAYIIRNVTHGNFALQSEEGTIVAESESVRPSAGRAPPLDLRKLWSISRLDNGKYTIRNIGTNHYAASSNFPAIEENLTTTKDLQQWAIIETGFKGRFVISTTKAGIELFWGLTGWELYTPISLRDRPNTPSNQWELISIDLWTLVGELRTNLVDLRDEHEKLREEYGKLQDNYTKLENEIWKDQKWRCVCM